jgi:flavin-dependent dehydrogenase
VDDVVIVGAGPAGAVAGIVLARAGVRVRLVDRATFPRDKLCGDTVNPGTLARLRALGVADDIEARGLRVDGMMVTGERGVTVEGLYPQGQWGRAIVRRDLDWLLLQQAIAAGCRFDPGVAVRGAIVDESAGARAITGVKVGAGGREVAISAPITIAADGRRSIIGFGLGLARHPRSPRRWAIGAYFESFARPQIASDVHRMGIERTSDVHPEDIEGTSDGHPKGIEGASGVGEMHVRRGRYIGVAQVPGGLTNVCLVRPARPADAALADPAALLVRELSRDPLLRDRAAGARLVAPPVVLGPLAVDVAPAAIDGLLLAGDAAGFIDPMTGDGLRFAIRGGELAAAAALDALAHGWPGVHARLAAARARDFAGKWRFNRALRVLVASPPAIAAAALAARVAPSVLRAVIARAGDCRPQAAPPRAC